jgi:hypothetical protein
VTVTKQPMAAKRSLGSSAVLPIGMFKPIVQVDSPA